MKVLSLGLGSFRNGEEIWDDFVVTSGKGEDEEGESGEEAGGRGWDEKGFIYHVNGFGLHSTQESGGLDKCGMCVYVGGDAHSQTT